MTSGRNWRMTRTSRLRSSASAARSHPLRPEDHVRNPQDRRRAACSCIRRSTTLNGHGKVVIALVAPGKDHIDDANALGSPLLDGSAAGKLGVVRVGHYHQDTLNRSAGWLGFFGHGRCVRRVRRSKDPRQGKGLQTK